MTKNMDKLDKFSKELKEIIYLLKGADNLIAEDYLSDFKRSSKLIETDINDILNTDRSMKIGIIGGIKAGKSTFLNALIFDGENILPKAATPMTAALTKLVYSEKGNFAKVHFYTKEGWEGIQELAEEYDKKLEKAIEEKIRKKKENFERLKKQKRYVESFSTDVTDSEKKSLERMLGTKYPEYKSSKELVEMAKKNGVKVESYLGTDKEITLNDDIQASLADYVGSSGKFTPIVSYIELALKNDLLKDIEVIDTPGLNDPVIARSKVTKDYLAHCDVVFLLSRSSGFLPQEDMELISRTLPSEGVSAIKLIASQSDMAALDDSGEDEKKTIHEVLSSQQRLLTETAEKKLSNIAGKKNQQGTFTWQPLYVSSMFYSAARNIEKGNSLSEEEEHVLKQCEENFIGFVREPKILRELSGINMIRETVWQEIKKQKEKILEQRSKEFIEDKKAGCIESLVEIRKQAENNLSNLQEGDREELLRKEEQINKALEKSRDKIKDIFEGCAFDCNNKILQLQSEVRMEVDSHHHVETRDIIETETRSRRKRTWIFFHKTEYYDVDVHHDQANVSDAEMNIRRYMNVIENTITNRMNSIINMTEVRTLLKKELLEVLSDNSDGIFESDDIVIPVNRILREINTPVIKIEREKYESALEKAFRNDFVRDEEIARLRREQNKVLRVISVYTCDLLGQEAKRIKNELDAKAKSFSDDVKEKLSGNIKLLRENLENKEKSIAAYEVLRKSLQQHIAVLSDNEK